MFLRRGTPHPRLALALLCSTLLGGCITNDFSANQPNPCSSNTTVGYDSDIASVSFQGGDRICRFDPVNLLPARCSRPTARISNLSVTLGADGYVHVRGTIQSLMGNFGPSYACSNTTATGKLRGLQLGLKFHTMRAGLPVTLGPVALEGARMFTSTGPNSRPADITIGVDYPWFPPIPGAASVDALICQASAKAQCSTSPAACGAANCTSAADWTAITGVSFEVNPSVWVGCQ